MLPTLEGVIGRRVLVNFRVDPDVARRLVPAPLEPAIQNGFAVAGICLIRLERLRPKGLPAAVGMSSENMAHRVAIRYPTESGMKDGVFIWRPDTDQALMTLLGGRLYFRIVVKTTPPEATRSSSRRWARLSAWIGVWRRIS